MTKKISSLNSKFSILNSIPKVPFLSIPDDPIIGNSQSFVPISDITEDIVLTKEGGASIVMESTSLNFGLLSEKEQQAVIYAYAALLNSLSFSIQISIRSQIKDISRYMNFIDQARQKVTNIKIASVMDNYKAFVKETIKKKNVLGKNFYIIIPFTPYELGVAKSAAAITRRKGPLPFPKSYVIKKAKIALYPKRDHLIRQAARLGIRLRQLSTGQLIQLYYNVFNAEPPTPKDREELTQEKKDETKQDDKSIQNQTQIK